MPVMTTYADSFDMTQWGILTDFAGGTFGTETATKFVVDGASMDYTFWGSGFTYDSNGVPTDGTITHLNVVDQAGGAENVKVAGIDLTVQQLETFAQTNNIAGLESTIFSGNDTFNVGDPSPNYNAVVHLNGYGGNDTFNIGNNFNPSDTFDGGAGYNTVKLDAGTLNTITPGTFQNIQKIVLTGSGDNFLQIEDPNISGGKTLTVDASQVASTTGFQIIAYLPVNVHLIGSAGNDSLFGDTANDHITGGLGSDYLAGGGGHNTFIYNSVAESTGALCDVIADFNAKLDHFQMPNAVTAVDPAITTGALDSSNFDADMSAALDGHLGANHAILFTPDSGNYAGLTLLVVDQSGITGYDVGGDIIIAVNGPHLTPQHLDHLSAANFIV